MTPVEGLAISPYQSDHNVLGEQVTASSCSLVLIALPVDDELGLELRFLTAEISKTAAETLLADIRDAMVHTTSALLRA